MELAEDPLRVRRDGARRDLEARRDRVVAQSVRDEARDLSLASGQAGACEHVPSRLVPDVEDDLAPEEDVATDPNGRSVDADPVHVGPVGRAQVDQTKSVLDIGENPGMTPRKAATVGADVAVGRTTDEHSTTVDRGPFALPGHAQQSAPCGRRDAGIDPVDGRCAVARSHERAHDSAVVARCQGAPLRAGTVVGRYVVRAWVGGGGQGDVYRALDPELDRFVALKVLRARDDARTRVLAEARALARLEHVGIVRVFDVGVSSGQAFLAMEYVEGIDAVSWVEVKRPSWARLRSVFARLAQSLDVVHGEGLLHRDVKPSNIMIRLDDEPVLVDFGLSGEAPHGARAGTRGYLAPEVSRGAAHTRASDVYALFVSMTACADAMGGRLPRSIRRLLETGTSEDPEARASAFATLQVRPRSRVVSVLAGVSALALGLVAFEPPGDIAPESGLQVRRAALIGRHPNAPVFSEASLLEARTAFEQAWGAAAREHDVRLEATGSNRARQAEAACLEHSWSLYGRVVAASADVPLHTVRSALESLPSASRCADGTELQVDLPRPASLVAAARVEQLRVDLDAEVALMEGRGAATALEAMERLEPDIRATNFDPLIAEFESLRSSLRVQTGDYDGAEAEARAAILRAARAGHVLAIVRTTEHQAYALTELGRYAEAAFVARRALADAQGRSSLAPERSSLHRVLSVGLRNQGKLAEAAVQLDRAAALVGTDRAALGGLRTEQARLLSKLGRRDDAVEAAWQAVDALEASLGPASQSAFASRVNLARRLIAADRPAEAHRILRECLLDAAPMPGDPYESLGYRLLADASVELGRLDDAAAAVATAETLAREVDVDLARGQALVTRARLADARGDPKGATRWTLEALLLDGYAHDSVSATALELAAARGRCGLIESLPLELPPASSMSPRLAAAVARLKTCVGTPEQAL